MKKLSAVLCFMLTALFVLTSCSSVFVTKNIITKDETHNIGEKPLDEGVVVGDRKDNADNSGNTDIIAEDNTENEAPDSTQDKETSFDKLLKSMGVVINEEKEIDGIAIDFAESLKNADTNAVSTYVGGKSEYYEFLKNTEITDIEIIPIEINQPDDAPFFGWYDRCDKYLCTIYSDGKSDAFKDTQSRYFLLTEEYSATGNPVVRFIPFEKIESLYNGVRLPQKHRLLVEDFIDEFSSVLTLGKNGADTFDFNNVHGFHFIPHLMHTYGAYSNDYEPYSMTEINEFIGNVFDGNKGVQLKTWQDYDLWVSVSLEDGYPSVTYDDKVYGCFYGHGANSVYSEIESFEMSDDGFEVVVNTYADYAYFTKARSMVFHFGKVDEGEYPVLFGIDVISDSGLEEASISF